MRSNGLSGVNGLIGFAVLVVPLSMGATAIILCLYFAGEWSYWIATGGFAALAAAAIAGYIIVLGRLDGIAAAVRQDMTEELCKT